jgi:cell division protease FtsH
MRRMVSEETAKAIDAEVKTIVETAYDKALALLNYNRDLLDRITGKLLETEVIEGDELEALLGQAKPVKE